MSNIVAIVGRPNVGKSTFFNRLIGQRQAIVDEFAGVTRDRHYGKTDWIGKEFTVVDTGGFVKDSPDVFDIEIRKQVKIAIEEAACIIFLVDAIEGLHEMDKEVAQMLRSSKKPVFLVANKVDHNQRIADAAEFYTLGLGEVFTISAVNGSGTGDLLDKVVEVLPAQVEEEQTNIPRIAVVGRPNAGKSSLINALLGEDRNIVTPLAGTTRDATDVRYNAFGFDFLLVDTAGIRKKGKVNEDLEFYSVMRSIKAIENADVCLLMIDATEGIGAQDLNIFHLIEKNRKGVVVLVNKWDLYEKETNTAKEYTKILKEKLAPFNDVEIIFTSATEKQRIFKAVEAAMRVHENRTRRIKTRQLNDVMLPIIEKTPPPTLKGKVIRIKFVNQLPTHAPSFAFYCNLPQYVKESYKRYLENQMRKVFDFKGVPIQIFFREK